MKKKLSIAVRASLSALAAASLMTTALAAPSDGIVTTVNGKPVPKARVEALMQQATRQGQPRTPELETQVRDEVVLREMFMQEAVKRRLSTTDEYKKQIEMARQSILIRELFSDFQKKNPVTDADIKAEYDKYTQQVTGNEYRARHILVEKEDEAKALLTQLKNGAKFEDLAKKNSKDPGSGQNGGDLDWANPTSYVPPFSEALVKLKKGETTTAPVKTDFGYHIIRLDDVRAAKPQSLEEMKPQLSQHLNQLKLTQFRDEVKAKSKTDYKFSSAN